MTGLRAAVLASVVLGAVMTFGDFLWAALDLRHRTLYGIVHGAVMCLCIGITIGLRTGRLAHAAALGPLVGVVAAAAFYVLAPWLRYSAMIPAWMLFWILFALLQERLLPFGSWTAAAARGVAAAVLSGLAFYAISGIWTRPSPQGPQYAVHLVYWTFAFLPGFTALFWRSR